MVASITAKAAIPMSIITMPANGRSILSFALVKEACVVNGLLYADAWYVDRAVT